MTQVHDAEKTWHGSTSPLTINFWLRVADVTGARILLDEFLLLLFVVKQVLFYNDSDEIKFAFIHFTGQGWRLAKQARWTGMGAQFNNGLACRTCEDSGVSCIPFQSNGSATSVFIVSFHLVWGEG